MEAANSVWLVVGVSLLVSTPILTLVHELGHAIAAVKLTGRRALVQIGDEASLIRFSVGRVDFRIDPVLTRAYCKPAVTGVTPRADFWICLAGPAASAAAALVLAFTAYLLRSPEPAAFWLVAAAAAVAGLDVLNLLPIFRPKRSFDGIDLASDGFQALELLRRYHGRPEWRAPVVAAGAGILQDFSDAGVAVVERAIEEARRMDHVHVGTEHLLLALAAAPGCAARVLASHGATADALGRELSGNASRSAGRDDDLPISPALRRIVADAPRALSLGGAGKVSGEHLLLGLLREPSSDAARVLSRAGVETGPLTRALMREMATPRVGPDHRPALAERRAAREADLVVAIGAPLAALAIGFGLLDGDAGFTISLLVAGGLVWLALRQRRARRDAQRWRAESSSRSRS